MPAIISMIIKSRGPITAPTIIAILSDVCVSGGEVVWKSKVKNMEAVGDGLL